VLLPINDIKLDQSTQNQDCITIRRLLQKECNDQRIAPSLALQPISNIRTMPSLLDLSAELQLLIIEYLDTPTTPCVPPAAYFAPRASRDIASLSSSCRTFRKLSAPGLFRNICLRNDDKSGKSLQAVGKSPWTASFVRELNFEARINLDEVWEEPNPLSDQDFSPSVEEVLSHLERFPRLECLSVQFKCGETESLDRDAVTSNLYEIWSEAPDPFRDFAALKLEEGKSDWRAMMARTYDAISSSKRPSTLTTLELRDVLPSGVSSFTTEDWQAFLKTLKAFRLSLHGCTENFNIADGYLGFIENLDLMFSQLTSVTEFRFAATDSGPPGVSGDLHATFPLNVGDMPMLEVFELRSCFINDRTARFIAAHVKTLRRIALEDCYSAASCELAEEDTNWAKFFAIIASALEKSLEPPPLEAFFVTPRILSRHRGQDGVYGQLPGGTPITGDLQQIELAHSLADAEPHRRPFDYAVLDTKYGYLREDGEENLDAFLDGHDQAAYDRVMAVVGRQSGGK
jgi:hypothetical protein